MLGSACQLWIFPNFQMIQRTSEDQTWASHVKPTTAADNTLTIPQFSSKVVIFNDGSDFMNQPIQGLPWRHLYLLHYWRQPLFRYSRDGARTTRKLLLRFFFPWVFSGGKHDTSMKLPSFDPYRSLMSTLNVYKWAGCSNLAGWNTEVLVSQCWVEVFPFHFGERISGHSSFITGISRWFHQLVDTDSFASKAPSTAFIFYHCSTVSFDHGSIHLYQIRLLHKPRSVCT